MLKLGLTISIIIQQHIWLVLHHQGQFCIYLQVGMVVFQTNKSVLIQTSLMRFQWVIVFWQTRGLPSKKSWRLSVLHWTFHILQKEKLVVWEGSWHFKAIIRCKNSCRKGFWTSKQISDTAKYYTNIDTNRFTLWYHGNCLWNNQLE